jgi:hypothetical protein
MKLHVKPRPIGIALLIFLILYVGLNIFTRKVGWDGNPDSDKFVMIAVIGMFPWLVSGYVAAWLGKTHGVLYGILLAPLTVLSQELDCLARLPALLKACSVTNVGYYLIYAVPLRGIGGLIWEIKELIKRRRVKDTLQGINKIDA